MARVERAILARTPEHDLTPSLDRIGALVDLLGDPQKSQPMVHVTGTNGKTSTSRMIDTLLRRLGLRVGRFTSPHLHSMTERISLHGEPLDATRFAATYDDIAPYVGMVDAASPVPVSYFEVLVGMAYAAFAEAPVDAAVVEVGMGGAWDATNVGDGAVAVVTPIAVDHERFLGSDVATIAAEKAGIIKPGSIAVLAQQPVEAAEVLLARAAEVGATVAREGLEFGVRHRAVAVGGQIVTVHGLRGTYDEIFLPLHGAHQAHNAACAIAAVEAFVGGHGPLDADEVRAAFAEVTSPGRLEVVRRSPTVLLDAAHNPAGAHATAAALREAFQFSRLVGVFAAFADKDVRGMLEAFEPVLAEVVVTEAASPRALPVDELAAVAVDVFGPDRVEVVARLDDALDAGVGLAEEEGHLGGAGVLVSGSIQTVAQARTLLARQGRVG
ncbi:MAG: bifunctional folylpolyglutamate synthase/dihydrofolate synthase [Actinomycetota bacterium]|nr:bifunctional folylpolyglutamate synthase/dihydrofolate synthase [Actinomycetota bacterium]